MLQKMRDNSCYAPVARRGGLDSAAWSRTCAVAITLQRYEVPSGLKPCMAVVNLHRSPLQKVYFSVIESS